MKKNKILLPLALFMGLLFANDLVAQYGYGNRYGSGYGYGNRFGRQRSSIPQAQEAPKKADPLTAEEIVDLEMPTIKEELGLDPFEEAVVRTTLVKSVQQRIELQILELEPQKMQEEVEKIRDRQDQELKTGLPEEKYLAYVELQENKFKVKKKKKDKKKKKKSKTKKEA
ncbi:hypothetical protein [Flagellimonas flava]|uniref:Periplasmic heavy metal sensor n=1 Tax=Flagellimonas flava TaxID=570519 RepID=A0A1M5J147_9FLAO|nr:hypothetical protein [Allomuricauda flava]SHG34262.1 hypothetical protein SAMN04488116_1057 [Allomuricauda flava]